MHPEISMASLKQPVGIEDFAYEVAERMSQYNLQDQNMIINFIIDINRKRRSNMVEELEQRTKELNASIQNLPSQPISNAPMR